MLTFKLAKREDAKRLSILRQCVWNETYRNIYPDDVIDNFDFKLHENKFLKQFDDLETEVYIIMVDEEIVGYFSIGIPNYQNMKEYDLYLKSLYILSKFQNLGIGSNVFQFVRSYCIERGFTTFFNSCNTHNVNAKEFYEKMGGELFFENSGHDNKIEDQSFFKYVV